MILAGDIGGTNTRLALVERDGQSFRVARLEILPSAAHRGLEGALAAFLGPTPPALEAAGFGIAGPVIDNRCRATNLPWEVDGRAIGAGLGLDRVCLVNDLSAAALGLGDLGEGDSATLQTGDLSRRGTEAVLAAGTGLGMALVARRGDSRLVLASEGGHADFAARGDELSALALWLERRHGHASIERVVSGPGIAAIHEFLVEECGHREEPAVAAAMAASDPARAITEAAIAGKSRLASRVLGLFVEALGATAGNLALTVFASGGVWLAGGIAPRILPALSDGRFLAAFADKGRFAPWLRSLPVRVVLSDRLAILGAARAALA